jgi:uncharacterized protein (TIGR03067 family)
MIRAEQNGEASPEFVSLGVELELTADTYTVRLARQVADQGTYVVNAGNLTLTGTEGPNAGRTIPCIFQLTGDRLRICYGLDGAAPTAFTTGASKPHYLATYRRNESHGPSIDDHTSR